ncbi:MAG: hypothetical protein HY738_03300 [Bacteroidia bacterium]|nr:hypothetical protein [Bacteroidia bacterium]
MMKKNILFSACFMIVSAISCFSQNNASIEPDKKLSAKYSQEFIDNLMINNPEIIEYLNFFVNNSYYFIDMPEKQISYNILKKLDIKTGNITEAPVSTEDIEKFNIYQYNYQVLPDKRNYYKAGETGKILIVLSEKEISQK